MNFLKRALLSVKVKKGRSLLLCAIFTVILIFILAGLTIQSASLKAADNAKQSLGATATLSANRENALSQNQESDSSTDSDSSDSSSGRPDAGSFSLTPVSISTATKISKLDNVSSYSILSSTSAGAGDDIEPISSADTTDSSTTTDSSADSNAQGMPGGGSSKQFGAGNAQGDFSISGVLSSALASDFSDETAKLTSGEAITKEDEGTNNVLIEKSLAEANDLKVGDTFTISNPTDEDTTYKMTVKGIYKTTSSSDSLGMNFNFLNPSNTLYTSYTFANTLKGDDYTDTADSVTYTLSDPEKLDAFVKAAKKLINTDTFSLETNDQTYQQMIEPISNVASFAKNIVLLVTGAGIIILSLIVMITIRERRYEIGVLLSIGESRLKVVFQFFVELFVIMLVSLVIAGFSGRIVGNVVGQQLLDQQTSATTSSSSNTQQAGGQQGGGQRGGQRGGFGNIGASSATSAKQIKKLDITLSAQEIGTLGAIGLGICFISVLLSSIGILRLQPKKILTT